MAHGRCVRRLADRGLQLWNRRPQQYSGRHGQWQEDHVAGSRATDHSTDTRKAIAAFTLELAQARLQVLASLIQREVLFQRAEQEKLLPSEDQITSAINQQKQQTGMTDEEFGRQLKEQNVTPEALREEAKKDLAIKALQDKYAAK